MPDHNEAMKLADEVRTVADRLQYTPGGFYGVETVGPLNQAAALLRQQAERIAELEGELRQMTNNAADLAVHSQEVEAERDQLLADAESLRARAMPPEPSLLLLDVGWGVCGGDGHASTQPNRQKINAAVANYKALRAAIAARTTHKETE